MGETVAKGVAVSDAVAVGESTAVAEGAPVDVSRGVAEVAAGDEVTTSRTTPAAEGVWRKMNAAVHSGGSVGNASVALSAVVGTAVARGAGVAGRRRPGTN